MEGQERVLFDAMRSWVERKVQEALPPGRRGMRAREPIRARLGEVETLMQDLVERVRAAVAEEVPDAAPGLRGAGLGRHKVMDNESACDGCGRVSLLAVIDVDQGIPLVECDRCAPELRSK